MRAYWFLVLIVILGTYLKPAGASTPLAAPEGPLFRAVEPFEFKLRASFQELLSRVNEPTVESPVDGVLEYDDLRTGQAEALAVRIKLRGNSSLRLCTFPKIEFSFVQKEKLVGTVFEGQRKIDLNTHCTPEGLGSAFPLREELIYRMMRVLGIPTYGSRPAAATYVESSTGIELHEGAPAFFLEDRKSVLKRTGGVEVLNSFQAIGAEPSADRRYDFKGYRHAPGVDEGEIARTYLLEAAVGNYDWILPGELSEKWSYLQNIKLIETSEPRSFFFPVDFDRSAIVYEGGAVRFVGEESFTVTPANRDKILELELAAARKRFEPAVFDQAKSAFIAKKEELRVLLAAQYPDMAEHLMDFYRHLEAP
jgi:hypothetical protein